MPGTETVISRRYVEVRKLHRYLDEVFGPENYGITILNDEYTIMCPSALTPEQLDDINNLVPTLRRLESKKRKDALARLQQPATAPAHVGEPTLPTAAGTPAMTPENDAEGPFPKPRRTGTVQSIKDWFGSKLGR